MGCGDFLQSDVDGVYFQVGVLRKASRVRRLQDSGTDVQEQSLSPASVGHHIGKEIQE
jgi:hypothetical protein